MFRHVAIAAVSGLVGATVGASSVMLLRSSNPSERRQYAQCGHGRYAYDRAIEILNQAKSGDTEGAMRAAKDLRLSDASCETHDAGLTAMLGVFSMSGDTEATKRLMASEVGLARLTMSGRLLVLCQQYLGGDESEGVKFLLAHKGRIPPDMMAYFSAYLLHPLGEHERAEALLKPLADDPFWEDMMPPMTFDEEWLRENSGTSRDSSAHPVPDHRPAE